MGLSLNRVFLNKVFLVELVRLALVIYLVLLKIGNFNVSKSSEFSFWKSCRHPEIGDCIERHCQLNPPFLACVTFP